MSKPIIYTDKGSGPVVVFVHGFCESKDIWKVFAEKLSTHYRVVCLDLPGFGESLLDRDEVSMEWFADEVHQFIKLLGIAQFTFIGHSLGGYVGLAYAEKYAQHLNGLCLFHSTAYADSEERKINRDKTIAFIYKYGADLFTQSFIEPLFLLKNRPILKNEITVLKAIAKQSSEKGIIATTAAMRDRADRTDVLATLKKPVLIIGGKNDATIPIAKLEELSQLSPMIQLAEIEDCGHMGMYEQKEKTFEVLSEFLYQNK
ncbi:alpha/beta fold hydrolase [Cytophaga aurantiaca]|uniref:alpha/beta fold hydrolase n=1 Tax=Cytophaga aurantiaca TaxID=29530 RepID=UPI00037939FF|nr:alpha/beta hydrolase [Cytophaga aurantiaca]